MYDVAKRAEVSQGTVSRVVRNDPSVRPVTRRAVLEAIAELGFVPNSAARDLRNARSHTIGLAIPDVSNWAFHGATSGITSTVRRHGYSLLLCDSEGKPEVEAANLRKLYERRVEGLLIGLIDEASPELERFLSAGVPVLALGLHPLLPSLPQISLNRRGALRTAFEHLATLGHRRIAFVNAKLPSHFVPEEDHRAVVLELGLPYDPSLVILATNRAECLERTRAVLTRGDRPSAVVSGGHITPFVLEGIFSAGLEIPRDISLVSMSDSSWAAVFRPPISAVSYNNVSRGSAAAEYIFARLTGQDGEDLLQEIQSTMSARGSTARAS